MAHQIDPAHTSIGFSVRHMMIAKVRGTFGAYDAKALLDADDLTKSKVEATIDVSSIDTGEADRDAHLCSPDFFDAENHPTIRFTSTAIEAAGAGRYRMTGDLTIKGTTRPVTLDVEATGPAKDPWGNTRFGFSLAGEIDREDFGLTWNQALETGGVLVGKKVKLEAEVQVLEVPDEAQASASA
jgi:polyisoprenoid-binding protein YceI